MDPVGEDDDWYCAVGKVSFCPVELCRGWVPEAKLVVVATSSLYRPEGVGVLGRVLDELQEAFYVKSGEVGGIRGSWPLQHPRVMDDDVVLELQVEDMGIGIGVSLSSTLVSRRICCHEDQGGRGILGHATGASHGTAWHMPHGVLHHNETTDGT